MVLLTFSGPKLRIYLTRLGQKSGKVLYTLGNRGLELGGFFLADTTFLFLFVSWKLASPRNALGRTT